MPSLDFSSILKFAQEFEEAAQTLRSSDMPGPQHDREVTIPIIESDGTMEEFENECSKLAFVFDNIKATADEASLLLKSFDSHAIYDSENGVKGKLDSLVDGITKAITNFGNLP